MRVQRRVEEQEGAAAVPPKPCDRAFLITTTGAASRLEQAKAELNTFDAAAQLGADVSVRAFERDLDDGARGCYTSHLSVYRDALASGASSALIVEDNVVFVEPPDGASAAKTDIIGEALTWAAESGGTWDVLHLALVHSAASLQLVRVQGHATVMRVQRTAPDWYGPVQIEKAPGLGTTAYLVSRRAMQHVVELDESDSYAGTPIDDLLAREFPGTTFAVSPALLHRGGAVSLINPAQEGFRAVMYNPAVFRKVESALVATGLSTSNLVWVFLGAMALWTLLVTLPVLRFILGDGAAT